MRLKETKEVANMIKRIEQGGGSETVQEDIILEGEASWLQGGLVQLTNAEDIEKLNHFKELTLANKHPRFGFTATYVNTNNKVAKEPDSITYADDMFYANFSVYFGTSFGWFGIALRNSISSETSEPIWEMNVSALS